MFLPNSDAEQSPASMIESGTETAVPVSLQSLTAVPLFGRLEASAVVKAPITAPKPVATPRLDIKLLGTVVAGDRSAAIMTVGTSAETTFFLGDVLYGRAFLKEVEADAVILSNQGHDERVSLSEGKAMTGGRVNPPSAVTQYMNPPVYGGGIPPAGMLMGQGMPPGMKMGRQGLPPGVSMGQGLPPGVIVGQPPMQQQRFQ